MGADRYISPLQKAPYVNMVKPIYDWTTEAIWTAPKVFGWDYNRAYDVMQKTGMSRHNQRVCPPYGEEPLVNLWQYAVNWPDLWEKMLNRVPGARTAARYSRGPIYAFSEVQKPPDLTWEQAIEQAVNKWSGKTRKQIKGRIRSEIHRHWKKTGGESIPDVQPHWYSGLSWEVLVSHRRAGRSEGTSVVFSEDIRAEETRGGRTRWRNALLRSIAIYLTLKTCRVISSTSPSAP